MALEFSEVNTSYDKERIKQSSQIRGCSINIGEDSVTINIPNKRVVNGVELEDTQLVFSKRELKNLVEELIIS